MTNKERVQAFYADSNLEVEIVGPEFSFYEIWFNDPQDRKKHILSVAFTEETAWEFAWEKINKMMIRKLES